MSKKSKATKSRARRYPKRGEVYLTSLDPTVGRELRKTRPAVVISNKHFNELTEMVVVLPVTSGHRVYVHAINLSPPDGGLAKKSHIIVDQVRSIDQARLHKRLGKLPAVTLYAVEQALYELFGLPEGNILT